MGKTPRKHDISFKSKVAMEIIRGKEPMTVICSRNGIHPTQARRWKDEAVESMKSSFGKGNQTELKKKDELIDELYRQIGQLTVERDWLKKKYDSI